MYAIRLGDGTELKGFRADGGCFIRTEEIDRELFTPERLHNVEITTDNPEEDYLYIGKHEVMLFQSLIKVFDEWWLCLEPPMEI